MRLVDDQRAILAEVRIPLGLGQQDVVVKSLGQYLGRSRGVSGASVLGDGQVVLIVDVPSLIKASRQSDQPAAADETVLERIAS